MNNDLKFLSPFKRMCITIGNLPTAYLESMSYYECLTFLVNYLSNNVIPVVNNNGEVVEELQTKFEELINYVDNYFENLNVQTEINNKLDEMAEQGELTQIILSYLEMSGLIMFDTLIDLKAAENVINGSFLGISGKNTYNDGLGALYRVREKELSDIADNDNLVELTNFPNLIAEKINNKRINDIESDISSINEDISTINGNIENINTNIGNLSNLDTTDKSSIVNSINETLSTANSKMSSYQSYKSQFYYYVDGVNGNDNNDGLTSATAFKTLDHFFELLNTSSSDIRCNIISAGTYKLSKTQVLNAHIHIVGTTNSRDDIIISSDQDEMVFYGGHFNFKNITWSMPNNYFDNALISIDNCVIVNPLRIYGGSVEIKSSTINQLRLSWSKGVISNLVIDGQDKTNNAIHLDSCSELTCFDTFTVSALSNSTSFGVIGVYRGTLHLVGPITNNSQTGDYYNGIVGNHILIDSTNTIMTSFNNIGSHGNDLGHTLLWTNNQDLPIE